MVIFEKGDAALCENYRPITVVSAGYELFAMMLLKRLQFAGAEERIWPTQFAFRSKRGSVDAIFVTTRTLDLTLADRDGTLVLLALDWSKERKPSIRELPPLSHAAASQPAAIPTRSHQNFALPGPVGEKRRYLLPLQARQRECKPCKPWWASPLHRTTPIGV